MTRRWRVSAFVPDGALFRLVTVRVRARRRHRAASLAGVWLRSLGPGAQTAIPPGRDSAVLTRRARRHSRREPTWLDAYEYGVELGWPKLPAPPPEPSDERGER